MEAKTKPVPEHVRIVLETLPWHEFWATPDENVVYVDVDPGIGKESVYVKLTIEPGGPLPDVTLSDVIEDGAPHPYGWTGE